MAHYSLKNRRVVRVRSVRRPAAAAARLRVAARGVWHRTFVRLFPKPCGG
ncbi:hypothetical protein A3768_3644 [Ralstonia solanacearum]|nr:hypothetical protein A3768_3644 [Ralstonia solanacearum]